MQVVAGMDPRLPLADVGAYAGRVEALGFDALHVPETVHDSLTVAALALQRTARLTVRTGVTLAFARSPMLTAYTSWDLAQMSGNRFELGLGTQVRANVEERLAAPFAPVVGRLADYVRAVQAAFEAFHTGEPIDHRGPHYQLTRLQPNFRPASDGVSRIPLWIGAVQPQLLGVAGQLADGLITHPTNSHPRWLAEIGRPALQVGADRAGRSLDDGFRVVAAGPMLAGATASDMELERERLRRMLAFVWSTPAYRATLELFGWADLGDRLRELTRQDQWDALAALVTDDVMDTLVPQARYEDLGETLAGWYGGAVDGVLLRLPGDPAHDPLLAAAVARLQQA